MINTPSVPEISGEQIRRFRSASKAGETKRALSKNWRAFVDWCSHSGVQDFPCDPATLEGYLVHLAEKGLKAASIDQARWAINARHKIGGHPAPGDTERVRVIVAGIKRTIGTRPTQKAALTIDHLRQVNFPPTLAGARDKALLLVGFAGGLRRSELAAIDVEHLEELEDATRIHIGQSKTDQERQGQWVDIVPSVSSDCCPTKALQAWLALSKIGTGPIFRSINRWGKLGGRISAVSIGQITKWAAAECGLDPKLFGGHSLRAGCATYLLDHGVPINIVAKQGRWKKSDTVLRYDRNATVRVLRGIY